VSSQKGNHEGLRFGALIATIAICAVIVIGLMISSVEGLAQGHDMSNMPGMKSSKPKAKRKAARRQNAVQQGRGERRRHIRWATCLERPCRNEYAKQANCPSVKNNPNGGTVSADADEYAWYADADSFAKSSAFSAAKDGDEHADAVSIARSFAENGNEYAGYANANIIAKPTSFSSTPDAYAGAFCQPAASPWVKCPAWRWAAA